MDSTETKTLLLSYRELKFKKMILEKQAELENNNNILGQIKRLEIIIDVLESCLSVLNQDEIFVIRYHIFQSFSWREVEEEYAKKYGLALCKSERTLKRTQTNALKKISVLIEKTSTAISLKKIISDNLTFL